MSAAQFYRIKPDVYEHFDARIPGNPDGVPGVRQRSDCAVKRRHYFSDKRKNGTTAAERAARKSAVPDFRKGHDAAFQRAVHNIFFRGRFLPVPEKAHGKRHGRSDENGQKIIDDIPGT